MPKSKKSPKRKRKIQGAAIKKFNQGPFIAAIKESMGSVTQAAKLMGCERQTIYNYMRAYPDIKKALETVRHGYAETCKEFARDNHLTALMEGSQQATAYELAKMDPKPLSGAIDPTKLGTEELIELQRLLNKAKPDGTEDSAI